MLFIKVLHVLVAHLHQSLESDIDVPNVINLTYVKIVNKK
jgi:hypothetical protein